MRFETRLETRLVSCANVRMSCFFLGITNTGSLARTRNYSQIDIFISFTCLYLSVSFLIICTGSVLCDRKRVWREENGDQSQGLAAICSITNRVSKRPGMILPQNSYLQLSISPTVCVHTLTI